MQTFTYTARDESGAPVSGTLSAESLQKVSQMLRAEGKYPINIRQGQDSGSAKDGKKVAGRGGMKLPRKDLIQLATQLSIMSETGVTLTEALSCIVAQAPKPQIAALVEDLSTQVQGGMDFSTALA